MTLNVGRKNVTKHTKRFHDLIAKCIAESVVRLSILLVNLRLKLIFVSRN
jgi:hypothetical protein